MNVIGEILRNRASFSPDLEALVFGDQRYTYQQYNEQVNQLANYFIELGIQKGDRITTLCKNSPQFAFIMMATIKVGAIFVPLNWRLKPQELKGMILDSKPKILFYDEEFSASLTQSNEWYFLSKKIAVCHGLKVLPSFQSQWMSYSTEEPHVQVYEDDPAIIISTSGTTGTPKGVVLSHKNIIATGIGCALASDPHYGDRFLIMTPFFHISGVIILINSIYFATTLVILTSFDSSKILDTIEAERVATMMTVPPILIYLLPELAKTEKDLSSLRQIACGGTTVPESLIRQYDLLGYPILHGYGATEVAGAIHFWVPSMGLDKSHSVGKPIMYVQTKIVHPKTREELPTGEVGEIAITGPQVFAGYWKKPEETQKVLKDGWFLTGDAGRKDENGFLYVIDRYKDIIICGGENIYPAEVESVVSQIDEVAEVALVGIPDPIWGEMPCACVVKKAEAHVTEEMILDECKEKLANYKVTKVLFVNELPKNAYGKVVKPLLREQLAQGNVQQ
ncbi:class I adenylate-forming enzyme family protein [Hazenella coriacea]|uniref:O-succinylbenzoate-CoA ligase n=1 Tax=Hazenella coriacea TaxID=1179467 RepID=A0A4R3LA50_9BACL|nr:AMP-binding protein [Hazenella coriacea]TCS96599.1 O-succinylbenzoate-CoA ligase [Hazenella coriacea]